MAYTACKLCGSFEHVTNYCPTDQEVTVSSYTDLRGVEIRAMNNRDVAMIAILAFHVGRPDPCETPRRRRARELQRQIPILSDYGVGMTAAEDSRRRDAIWNEIQGWQRPWSPSVQPCWKEAARLAMRGCDVDVLRREFPCPSLTHHPAPPTELEIYRAALETIKRDHGRVCPNFEICDHVSCSDSSAAWLIADAALNQAKEV